MSADVNQESSSAENKLLDELKAAQAIGAAVIDVALDAVVIANNDGRITGFNPAAEKMFGYKASQVIGKLLAETIVPPHHRAAHSAGMKRHKETGISRVLNQRLELEAMKSDGTVFPVEIAIHRVAVSGQTIFAAYLRDLTAAKEAERRIREQELRERAHQSEKLSAMGSLLAGVAHELNNPLAIVVAYSSMLEEMAADPSLKQKAQKINAAAERCARIVKSFLAMVRQKPPLREPADLNQLISGVCDMLNYGLKSAGVRLEKSFDPNLQMVEADSDLFSQVIANLIINAQQALTDRPGDRIIWITTQRAAAGVSVEIADNGPGIPKEIVHRIFEPYFTTKPAGVGTGIGLSICHNVVHAHGGKLDYADRPGGGASFRIFMPPADVQPQSAPKAEAGPSKGMSILVVDDEADVAEMLADMLESAGHRAHIAHTPQQVYDIIDAGGIDAVFTDLRMPQMNGAELRKQIAARNPRLGRRTVIMTGDTIAGPITIKAAAGNDDPLWIEKPFMRHEILELLNRVQKID